MPSHLRRRKGLGRGQLIFLAALAGIGLVLASQAFLRGAREVAVEPSLAEQAKAYLLERNVKPLTGELRQLLVDDGSTIASLNHPLLGKRSPGFDLHDHTKTSRSSAEFLAKGPLVVVFYYGYYCNHCVSQLFAIDADIAKFRELGAEVVAISADPPEDTVERFKKFGSFQFPVLSDPGNRIAAEYGVYRYATRESPERLMHGTFVISPDGVVRWCHFGDEPFTHNATLLRESAKITGALGNSLTAQSL